MTRGKGGDDVAVVGLALRFALNARPTGSQGSASGKANDKDKSKNEEKTPRTKTRKRGHYKRGKKGDILKEL
jgi:hypothetical protein